MQNFIGKDGFIWWLGVIENRDDPLNLGRCQVRCFGWHTPNLSQLPTTNLPWALPMNSGNNSMTAAAPLVGDYAFGFFSDGMNGQSPYMIGVFPGIPVNSANPSMGFSEGNFYPTDEPTTSRLYRNDGTGPTTIDYHNNNLDTGVPTASGGSWSEPMSGYATQPPYNRVTETVAGHILELDDTPGAERIHLNHKKDGLTFFEIAPDGSKVTKVQGTNYEVYLSDNNIHVKGVCNITVDGDTTLYVKGNVTEKVDGNVDLHVLGNVTEKVDGNVDLHVNGNVTEQIDGNANIHVNGNVTEQIDGNMVMNIGGTFTGTASSWSFTGNITENGSITASGDVIGAGVSLDNHVHGGVSSGMSKTSPPV